MAYSPFDDSQEYHDSVAGRAKKGQRMKDKILQWFAYGRVGMSSKAMACCLIDSETDCSHPYDPDDLNRCMLFLEAVPEARQHMDKIAAMSPSWAALVARWNEIEGCFLDEVGFNWCKANCAKKTYELMDEILKEARHMTPGRDFTPKDLMRIFGYPRDIAYHPRLAGRYKAGNGRGSSVFINRELFMRRRASGASIIDD